MREDEKSPSIMGLVNHKQDQMAAIANLRERIASRAIHAQQEANRAARLNRLIYLMDKNPDLCEIIDHLQSLNLL